MSWKFWNGWDTKHQVLLLIGVVVAFLLVLIAVFVLVCCCFYRRRRRMTGYTPLPSNNAAGYTGGGRGHTVDLRHSNTREADSREESFGTAMRRINQERTLQRRDNSLRSCQFYIRSMNMLVFDTHLPDIGSRMSKSWFLVKHINRTMTSLLTMLPISQQCRLNLHDDKDPLRRLIGAIKHMNVHQILDIDYIPESRLVVILEPLHARGSLKDLLYQTTPNLSWTTKYSICGDGLRVKQIQKIGRQVLHGVLFLYYLGFKPLGQIQSGNIYIEGGVIKLSGYENYLLGYKPRIHRLVKGFKNRIDSAMFGHLIFELSTGREPVVAVPAEEDISTIRYKQIQNVLNFIFYNEQGTMPSIDDILAHPFFCEQDSDGLNHWSYTGVRIDEEMRRVIESSKTGRLFKGHASTASSKKKKHLKSTSVPSSIQATRQSTTSPIALTPIIQSPSSSTYNMNPVDDDITEDRTELLEDIRTGTPLRKTITDDRSGPALSPR